MNTNFEIIEKYIDGELEGQELINFEKLPESNADIKRDYQLSLEINYFFISLIAILNMLIK